MNFKKGGRGYEAEFTPCDKASSGSIRQYGTYTMGTKLAWPSSFSSQCNTLDC